MGNPRVRVSGRRHSRGRFGGLYYIDGYIMFPSQDPKEELPVIKYLPHMIIDIGTSITTIGGYDAKRLGIDYAKLRPAGRSLVGGHSLVSYSFKNVMFVFRGKGNKPCYEFIPICEVLAAEPNATKS